MGGESRDGEDGPITHALAGMPRIPSPLPFCSILGSPPAYIWPFVGGKLLGEKRLGNPHHHPPGGGEENIMPAPRNWGFSPGHSRTQKFEGSYELGFQPRSRDCARGLLTRAENRFFFTPQTPGFVTGSIGSEIHRREFRSRTTPDAPSEIEFLRSCPNPFPQNSTGAAKKEPPK